jgi:hypothetical protein
MVETETYQVESPDGDSDEFELPVGLVDVLAEQGEQKSAVAAEIALMGFVQRAHSMAHHGQGEKLPADLDEIAEKAEELFEERFGLSFAEATGHQH